ncbi:MAG: hypothetical protein GW897_04890 [bacterium]|nr:hypothetical protein [bacterium]
MDREEYLSRAKDHLFMTGVNDNGMKLCAANMVYGIAKIHFLQEKLGLKADATFISTPDATITRNAERWNNGFGYGGKIEWGNGTLELMILDLLPNACGMLVGGLEELPQIETLIDKVSTISVKSSDIKVNGIKVVWDFGRGNHFIDVFKVRDIMGMENFLPYIFIIHGAGDELRDDNPKGYGLYYYRSKRLENIAKKIDTPFGKIRFLTGKEASDYYEKYKFVDDFSKRRRIEFAKRLFGDFKIISNETHQGLADINTMLLGCHLIKDNQILPIALRGDLPAYLVYGKPSFTKEQIENLGFEKRAKKLDLTKRLRNANVVPHGGGYHFPDILSVLKVIENNGQRYFLMDLINDRGKKVIKDLREIPYDYRGRMVVLRTLELDLAKIIAKLIPLYVLKI